jgi:hypothetical protein
VVHVQTKKILNKSIQLQPLPGSRLQTVQVDQLLSFADRAIIGGQYFVLEKGLERCTDISGIRETESQSRRPIAVTGAISDESRRCSDCRRVSEETIAAEAE